MTVLTALNPRIVLSENTVVINEFTVDPEQKVELWNTTSESIDISNWYLDDSAGTTYFTVPMHTILYPGACTVFTENLNLNKSSADQIRLFDSTAPPTTSSARLIDSFAYAKSPGFDISWFRLPDGANLWATGSANIGNSNALGTACYISPTPTTTSGPIITTTIPPSGTPTPTIGADPSACIILSEIMPYPTAGNPEWVELYNMCSDSITLTEWTIDDVAEAGSSPVSFSLSIPGLGFKTIYLQNSILNNSGDSIGLYDADMNLVDSHVLLKPEQNKTFSRQSPNADTLWCLTSPTIDAPNNACSSTALIAVVPPLSLVAESIPTPTITAPRLTLNLKPVLMPTPGPGVLGLSVRKLPNTIVSSLLIQLLIVHGILAVTSVLSFGITGLYLLRSITQ